MPEQSGQETFVVQHPLPRRDLCSDEFPAGGSGDSAGAGDAIRGGSPQPFDLGIAR